MRHRFVGLLIASLVASVFVGASAPLRGMPAPQGDTETQAGDAPLTDDEVIVHMLNRFSPGATPELIADVKARGLAKWVKDQLEGEFDESRALRDRRAPLESINQSVFDILANYYPPVPRDATPARRAAIRRRNRIPLNQTLQWVVYRSVYSNHVIREVSADFFRNHFAVDVGKGEVRYQVLPWERDVIRRNALGNFGEMLMQSAKHPAMLYFLDNHISRRPATESELKAIEQRARGRGSSDEAAARLVDIARQRGLNENYARELLELHTLGVDNVYTQEDVIQVARCLTGWSIHRSGLNRGNFRFVREMHDPGNKPFLSNVIRGVPGNPVAEGERVVEVLIRHRGTARFLAWKLCRFFVNDSPDPDMVKRIARVFRRSRGDLPKVFKAIIEDDEFVARHNFRAKYRRPYEFVVAALRVTHAEISNVTGILQALAAMNESLYRCADPTGYYDQAEAWRDPGSLAVRWVFAKNLMAGRVPGVRIPASFYEDLNSEAPDTWTEALIAKVLPVAGLDAGTRVKVDRYVAAMIANERRVTVERLAPKIVAILLGLPEFQKQ